MLSDVLNISRSFPNTIVTIVSTGEGNVKATLKRFMNNGTVDVELDPRNTWVERGSDGQHRAESNDHFDATCSLCSPGTWLLREPCK